VVVMPRSLRAHPRRSAFLVLAPCVLVLAGLVLAGCGGSGSRPRSGTRAGGTTQLVYRLDGRLAGPGSRAAQMQLLTAMGERLADAGLIVKHMRLASARLQIDLQGAFTGRSDRARFAYLGSRGRLFVYDWEANVLGPRGRPQPNQDSVTGGPDAGDADLGLSEYDAVLRASRRRAIRRPNDTNGRLFYLVDDGARKVVRGPAPSRASLLAGGARSAGTRIVKVRPGTTVVAALRPQDPSRQRESGYYVLNDNPVISSAEILDPQAGVDSAPDGTGQPDVTFDFSGPGGRVWLGLTRALVRRGEQAARTGVPAPQAYQHVALVLDDRLLAVPAVDFSTAPNGLDPADGGQIIGGFSTDTADELASILRYRPLPVGLSLASVRRPAVAAQAGKRRSRSKRG